jgi:uncharacterized protein YutE (UPF0331/DUF86 family)
MSDQYDRMIEESTELKKLRVRAWTDRLAILAVLAFSLFVIDGTCTAISDDASAENIRAEGYRECVEKMESVTVYCEPRNELEGGDDE